MKANYEIKKVGYIEPRTFTNITLDGIMELVADVTGITVLNIKSKSRKREIVSARHIFNYFAYKYTINSYSKIGIYLGGRDHSTVLTSKDTCMDLVKHDKPFRRVFEDVEKHFKLKYGSVDIIKKRQAYTSPFNN